MRFNIDKRVKITVTKLYNYIKGQVFHEDPCLPLNLVDGIRNFSRQTGETIIPLLEHQFMSV
jgi:hypothetical protein